MLYLKLLKNQHKKLFFSNKQQARPLLETLKSRALEVNIFKKQSEDRYNKKYN